MPNANVNSPSSFYGKHDHERHGIAPARRETYNEMFERTKSTYVPRHDYEEARQRGEVTYSPKPRPR